MPATVSCLHHLGARGSLVHDSSVTPSAMASYIGIGAVGSVEGRLAGAPMVLPLAGAGFASPIFVGTKVRIIQAKDDSPGFASLGRMRSCVESHPLGEGCALAPAPQRS